MAYRISADGSSICDIAGAEWLVAHHRRAVEIDIMPSRSGTFAWYFVALLDDATTFVERFDDLSACRKLATGADVRLEAGIAAVRFPNAVITDHTLEPCYRPDETLCAGAIFLGRTDDTDLYVMAAPHGLVPMARIDAQTALYPLYPLTPEDVAAYRRGRSPLAVAHDLAVATGYIPEVSLLARASLARPGGLNSWTGFTANLDMASLAPARRSATFGGLVYRSAYQYQRVAPCATPFAAPLLSPTLSSSFFLLAAG